MTDTLDQHLIVRRVGLGTELIDYEQGWELQRQIHTAVCADELPPTILLLEHAEVFTAGKRTQPSDRPTDGSKVVEVDRGGRITWHGPGQLVCYPIVRLPQPFDVVAHVRRLEEAAIRTCADFGVQVRRVEGRSGVWVTADSGTPPPQIDQKIAAIGVRVARGVTMHGLAINVDCDLTWADRIVACGITDASVTSLAAELGQRSGNEQATNPSVTAAADRLERHIREVLAPTLLGQSA
ncbi:MAG: lipoyl(octanoyl) transferase LipB [Candidatus Nanopelagicales bacterium]